MGNYLVHKVGTSVVWSVENYWSLVHDDNLEMLVTNQQQQQCKLAVGKREGQLSRRQDGLAVDIHFIPALPAESAAYSWSGPSHFSQGNQDSSERDSSLASCY